MKKNERKILGIIGGMGPLATQLFYKKIIEMTEARKDQEHLDIIILSHASIPDRTTEILAGRTLQLAKILQKDAVMLEKNGVSNIAIPCNTSHVIKETVKDVKNNNKSSSNRIGILATDGTIKTGLYQKELKKEGFIPVVPEHDAQKLVMKIIYDGIKNGGEIDYNDFLTIEKEIKNKGCEKAILACTELSCFKDIYKLDNFYIDAMDSLAKSAIIASGAELKR